MKAFILAVYVWSSSSQGWVEVETEVFLSREDCIAAAYEIRFNGPIETYAECYEADNATQTKYVGLES